LIDSGLVFLSKKAATTAKYNDWWSLETASDVTGSQQIAQFTPTTRNWLVST